MEFDTQTLMMFFFLLFLSVSIWKISAFLPNKVLVDDDTTQASHDELVRIMLKVIKNNENLNEKKIFELMLQDAEFDKTRFWRFNQNRLNQLLNKYYLENAELNSIEDIYKDLKA
jgi:hypothetical protein